MSGLPVELATRMNLGPGSGSYRFRPRLVGDRWTPEVGQPPAEAEDGGGHFRSPVEVVLRDGHRTLARRVVVLDIGVQDRRRYHRLRRRRRRRR